MGLIDAFITKPFVARYVLLLLITSQHVSVVTHSSIPFFKAARTNDIFNRRMLVSGVFGSGLLFLGIACYDWKFGETVSEKGEGVPPSAQSYTLTDYGVFALLDGAFLMVVVEAELWWEKIRLRRQMEERIRQELLEARKEIGEREPVEKMILPSRCLESDSVEFETAAQN